jgi:hypothetical protein
MKFGKSIKNLYNDVKKSLIKESTILMQGDEEGAELEEYNKVSKELLNKIRRLLGANQKNSQNELIQYLKTNKNISEGTAKKIALYVEHYSEDPEKTIDYILNEQQKVSLHNLPTKTINLLEKLKDNGFNAELIESLISLKEQGSGPAEYLFCIAVKDMQKRSKSNKDSSDGGDLELMGTGGGKVELKGNSGILRSGKENTFGTPIECSKYWREELSKRLTRYGMLTDLQELPDATAKPGGGKGNNLSFKINNANRLTVDIFGKRIIQKIDEIKRHITTLNTEKEKQDWLNSENIQLKVSEVEKEEFTQNDLIQLWANGFHRLFLKANLLDIVQAVTNAYSEATTGTELGIGLRNNLLLVNFQYYKSLDDFKYFILFDHISSSKTFGKALVLKDNEIKTMTKDKLLELVTIVSAPDFSREVVSSGATSIKINASLLEQPVSE